MMTIVPPKKVICPNCGEVEPVIYDDVYLVCPNCGTILDYNAISDEREYRIFSAQDFFNKSRVALNGWVRIDDLVSASETTRLKATLSDIVSSFREMIPATVVRSANDVIEGVSFYIKCNRGEEKEFCVACLYIASLMVNIPIPLALFKNIIRIRTVRKYIGLIKEIMNISGIPKPEDCLNYFKVIFDERQEIIAVARDILERVNRIFKVGKNPHTLALASIILAKEILGVKKNIARYTLVGVSRQTISRMTSALRKQLRTIRVIQKKV